MIDNESIKVSFDFDGTLNKKSIQEYAYSLIQRGFDVWIVTRRYDSVERYTEDFKIQYKIKNLVEEHKYLFELAKELGIKRDHIIFMNMDDKWKFFKNKDFLWHLDDDSIECNDIYKHTKTFGISCADSNWKHKCDKIINAYLFNKVG